MREVLTPDKSTGSTSSSITDWSFQSISPAGEKEIISVQRLWTSPSQSWKVMLLFPAGIAGLHPSLRAPPAELFHFIPQFSARQHFRVGQLATPALIAVLPIDLFYGLHRNALAGCPPQKGQEQPRGQLPLSILWPELSWSPRVPGVIYRRHGARLSRHGTAGSARIPPGIAED